MPKLTARRKRAAAPAPEAAFEMPPSERPLPLIKVVGISAAGKSTLVQALRQLGYDAKPISQEHSYIPTLWRRFSLAHLLLYLDNDLVGQRRRRPELAPALCRAGGDLASTGGEGMCDSYLFLCGCCAQNGNCPHGKASPAQ